MSNQQLMRKKVRAGAIHIDPTSDTLLVDYEVEAEVLNDAGQPVLTEKKSNVKRINITRLSANSSLSSLAQEIVEKCKLIHPSKLPLVEQLLENIRDRQLDRERLDAAPVKSSKPPSEPSTARQREEKPRPTAVLGRLGQYIEQLYEHEHVDLQITAALQILDLSQIPANLEELINDETLFGVLARLLKEEARKDIDLTTVIISIFSCFAAYSQFHPILLQHRVGHTCMRLVDREMERRNVLYSDLEKARTSLQTSADKIAAKEAYQKVSQKIERVKSKQEALLAVCFSVLLHLAEDMAIEKKMKKHNIVSNLVLVLDAENSDLLSVVLLFLKKLSIIKENKDEMATKDIVSQLARLLMAPTGVHEGHVIIALRLLLNLSFSSSLQSQIVNANLLPHLVGYIRDVNLRQTALRILYHLSMDDKHKSLFTYTEAIPFTMKMVLDDPSDKVNREVIALAINLASNQRNAELMCEGTNMQQMVKRAVKTSDALLFKFIKTISSHDGKPREYFQSSPQVIADIVRMAKSSNSSDLLVELLGILGNLSGPGINWVKLAEDHNLVPTLTRYLNGSVEDDVILEAVIVLGTIASDPKSAHLLLGQQTIPGLAELIVSKQEDDEIVLQCVYTFYRLLLLPEPREKLLTQTQVPSYLIDLLYDKNIEIQKLSDQALDLIMDYDAEWAKRIRKQKYQRYNSEWIKAVQGGGLQTSSSYTQERGHNFDDFDSDEGF